MKRAPNIGVKRSVAGNKLNFRLQKGFLTHSIWAVRARLTEKRNPVALFLQLQRPVHVCVCTMRDQGGNLACDGGWGLCHCSSIQPERWVIPFSAERLSRPFYRQGSNACRGLLVGFLGSNGSIRTVRIVPVSLQHPEQLCLMSPKPVTESLWDGLCPRKHLRLWEKPGVVLAAPPAWLRISLLRFSLPQQLLLHIFIYCS